MSDTTLGVKFGFESATPGTYTNIATIKSLKWDGVSANTIEKMSHDDVDGYKKFIGGLIDAGSITLTLEYDDVDTEHAKLYGYIGMTKNFQVESLIESKKMTGSCVVTAVGGISYELEGLPNIDVTVKVSGKPTWA